jgi:two-component system, OmpR family, alkaline phosphatase synthesis response regulator PhoP
MPTNKKILLVDDDETLCQMYQDRLEASDFEVEVVHNGEDGFKKAKELKPDLILLDIMMPKVNGYEVYRRLKNEESTSSIPVIFLTALIKDEKKLKEIEEETDDKIEYIHKSEMMPGEVTKVIEKRLSN